ncbi:CRISPR-associated endonuclease Cas1 [Actinoalloteichus sp. AHMU CJ021]|uniref:CRISPR-associated endonuclease Cas1 n=1 Tax=Actinoalloteichus caeruleus DSM 43889 TaxID=1120930 RepID=A0ABT1JCB7_ACTCY|nr:CRISPR-associated endonuclease Cas1 [Actinoalloteichus caeruleus]AUS80742.1 CRISPR-associated endonuclease Cas1 [Actinoalloteichus sp. AHMU CJ021]MCP2330142.1 CRISP-associated protein Cas1 [Actinoalloteichus caeruleus DSM 43889]
MTEALRTLFISTPGTSLGLDGDAVRITSPDRPGRHLQPLVRLDHLVVNKGVHVSEDLFHRCSEDGRSVTWLSQNGKLLTRTSGRQTGGARLRIEQVRAYDDPARRLALARAFVAGKLHNYRQLVLRIARDRQGGDRELLRDIAADHAATLPRLREADDLDTIRGLEGSAARRYFQAMGVLIPGANPGRTRRPPTDPVNCALSFGYTMLEVATRGAVDEVGLDPFIGYLHDVRPGKASLSLDLMEEFRTMLVDRLVITLFNKKQLSERDMETLPGGEVRFTEEGRKAFLSHWSTARDRMWHHPVLDREVPASTLPLLQARLLARHLRGDTPTYTPWSAG